MTGLAPAQIKALERLYRRRTHPDLLASPQLLASLAEITADTGRQIGVLLDRRGRVRGVSVGTPRRIEIPRFDRSRSSAARLAGLRFVHSHPSGEGLDPDDLTDLALLRLDAIAALCLGEDKRAGKIEMALLAPPTEAGTGISGRVDRTGLLPPSELPDRFLARVSDLERELGRRADLLAEGEHERATERAVLVCVSSHSRGEAEERMEELAALAQTAGVAVVGREIFRMRSPDPATLIGRGRIERLTIDALHRGAGLLIFDRALSPVQVKNLGAATDLKVIDRTQLILDIFAQHARSQDGKLQVELAQQRYRLPRLVGRNPALSRLAGGIGGQGPGETKLEIDRRRARERITRLERELGRLESRRALGRKSRGRGQAPLVSLVGYTNAGKSTLFNQLTQAHALTQDQLFATLDPTTRRLYLGEASARGGGGPRQCLLSDTVGFIRDLPEELLRAFHATLEELRGADLLLHVVDASSPNWQGQEQSVREVLDRLGLAASASLTVCNKADLLDAQEQTAGWPGPLVSARTGEGLCALREAIAAALAARGAAGPQAGMAATGSGG